MRVREASSSSRSHESHDVGQCWFGGEMANHQLNERTAAGVDREDHSSGGAPSCAWMESSPFLVWRIAGRLSAVSLVRDSRYGSPSGGVFGRRYSGHPNTRRRGGDGIWTRRVRSRDSSNGVAGRWR